MLPRTSVINCAMTKPRGGQIPLLTSRSRHLRNRLVIGIKTGASDPGITGQSRHSLIRLSRKTEFCRIEDGFFSRVCRKRFAAHLKVNEHRSRVLSQTIYRITAASARKGSPERLRTTVDRAEHSRPRATKP